MMSGAQVYSLPLTDDPTESREREVGVTQQEALNAVPYEVEFMNAVVDKANDLQVVDADSHFARFVGVHPSKIKEGKLFLYDKLKPADRERVMQSICKKGARFTYITMDLLDQKGAPLFVHCVGQNYEDSTLCRMTFADVSESRRRQERLRAKTVEMNELIDLVCGGVCLFKVTPEMHIECLYLNQGCCRLFGTSQESSRQRAYRLDELLHPDDRSAVFQAIGRAMAVGEEVECECRVRVHENEFIWCQLQAGIQRFEGECPVFHAVFTDITRIKEAEEKADREAQRLVSLFKNLPGATFFTDTETPLQLDLVSEDFIQFIGYSRTELFDLFSGNLGRLMDESEAAAATERLRAAAATERLVTAEYTLYIGDACALRVRDSRKVIDNPDGSKAFLGVLNVI